MARRKQAPKDLIGIRQRGGRYQIRLFGGRDPSVSSVRKCHAVLSGALNAALRWGWIAVNPLEAVKRPRQRHPKPIHLSVIDTPVPSPTATPSRRSPDAGLSAYHVGHTEASYLE
jgi:hypothetical protein